MRPEATGKCGICRFEAITDACRSGLTLVVRDYRLSFSNDAAQRPNGEAQPPNGEAQPPNDKAQRLNGKA